MSGIVVFSDFGGVFGGCGVAISEDRPQSQNGCSVAINNSINICPIAPKIVGIDRKSSN